MPLRHPLILYKKLRIMEIILLVIGKTRTSFISEAIKEYSKRLKHYLRFNIIEISDIKTSKSMSQQIQKEKEGKLILENTQNSDFLILLDERGKEYTSEEFANYIERLMGSGRKRTIFAVGGPYGFSKDVYERADAMISLSRMTFNHEMVRAFFIEQTYRAMTIIRGEPYHHS